MKTYFALFKLTRAPCENCGVNMGFTPYKIGRDKKGSFVSNEQCGATCKKYIKWTSELEKNNGTSNPN